MDPLTVHESLVRAKKGIDVDKMTQLMGTMLEHKAYFPCFLLVLGLGAWEEGSLAQWR